MEDRTAERKEIFTKLLETQDLPTLSQTALKVLRLSRSSSASLNDLAEVIKLDPILSAEILKYANASFLSTGIQVVSIQKPVVKLGLKTVVNLVVSLSLLANNKKGGGSSNFNYNE